MIFSIPLLDYVLDKQLHISYGERERQAALIPIAY
jgi:hypothetical protein